MFVVWSKYYVRDRLGLRTDSDLAKLFGVSRSAVSQWPKNKAIPQLRRYMLQQKYPVLFPSGGEGCASDVATRDAAGSGTAEESGSVSS
ncbi:Cro/CI family transcriptional regulator [Stenotrophomonas sp. 24(2023)]|uniref:Cro/CI family transcriptional regulator n=1 Tax=Stenotrophomonas sp. 24(2023) TaxID=3068324 RepID=UPI0027E02287|nr:Cro/CI family transcriptional regulator [Stenotrophomonas sp. 24(2023)]WMJ68647.1 Cro/CI family transcriptional regulator [Stenotrophomonas sp. 24(2023)]